MRRQHYIAREITGLQMKREHQFKDLTREEWERVVFEEADHFTCTRYMGRKPDKDGSKFKTRKHPNILEAVKDAVQDIQLGGQPMIYAVASSERNVLIPRDQWVPLIEQFAERNPDYV